MFKKTTLARLALIEVATFWGMSWVGFRALNEMGMSAMGAGVACCVASLMFALALAWGSINKMAWRKWSWVLLGLMMAGAALSNLGFTWGMVHGEVMRVMLLFYLMPVWSGLMAHFILKEPTNWAGWLGIALGLLGAGYMLYDPALGAPYPASAAEWSGLAAGFGSAVLNVCVKKTAGMAENVRAFLQILGAVLLGLVWLPFEAGSALPRADSAGAALLVVLFMGAALLMTNRLYQFGVSNLTMHQAVVIFPFELVVGALSSWLLKGEVLNMQTWVGGGLILGASLVSSWWGVTDDAERV